MAARHRARFGSIHIVRVVTVADEDIRRPHIKQITAADLSFPLPHRLHRVEKSKRSLFLAKSPSTFY